MLNFIYQLKAAGIPVSVRYILDFYRGLARGLAPDLDRLFVLARLVFVKRVEHYDLFEQVFGRYFFGREADLGALDRQEVLAGKPFQDWLREQLASGALSEQEIRQFDSEELLTRFWETVLAQQGRHRGGHTWVGTQGRSPYGHSGREAGGVRVYGEGRYGSAQKVIGRRRFVNYSEASPLAAENLRQALAALKSLRPLGPLSELDVEETIHRTAKNGGEIELVFQREIRNRVQLMVFLDNGGQSMGPYVGLVRTVFGKIRDQFRELSTYYFHNCIYGAVYRDPPRTQAVKWEDLIQREPNSRLVIIGDANMAPAEMMAAYGSVEVHTTVRRPGYEWLRELRAHFPASIWLNPIPKHRWPEQSATIDQIRRIFRMEDLTLGGIKNAVAYLNEQGREVDRW